MERRLRPKRIKFEEVMVRVMANDEDNNEAPEDERKELLYVWLGGGLGLKANVLF